MVYTVITMNNTTTPKAIIALPTVLEVCISYDSKNQQKSKRNLINLLKSNGVTVNSAKCDNSRTCNSMTLDVTGDRAVIEAIDEMVQPTRKYDMGDGVTVTKTELQKQYFNTSYITINATYTNKIPVVVLNLTPKVEVVETLNF